ncbi:MAG: glutathione S-transferase family protein [Gammaproteobacteria bacterium]|nr:glutathione S-transferase family protein [Gammaproteobacteria bacterium]
MGAPVVYGPRFSTYVRSALIALEEKGADYEVHEVNILEGAHQTPEHLARHPFAKVPAFSHDGFDLYEGSAILQYVDAGFPGPSLQPDDAKAKARMHQVIGIIDSYAYPAFITQIVIPRVVVPMMGGETDEAAVKAALPQAEKCVNALNQLIGGNKFMAGTALSLADIHLVPVYDYLSQTPDGESLLANAAGLRRWWDGVKDRDSVTKTRPQLG